MRKHYITIIYIIWPTPHSTYAASLLEHTKLQRDGLTEIHLIYKLLSEGYEDARIYESVECTWFSC